MISIGVIVPTVGRESLDACLDSVSSQLGPEDTLLVMYDGGWDKMIEMRQTIPKDFTKVRFYALPPGAEGYGEFGHPQRNRALEILQRLKITHAWSIDDDDIALPGAIETIRTWIENIDNWDMRRYWLAFQIRFGPGSHANGITVWRDETIRLGDIGTPCIVWPTDAASRWGTLGVDQFGRDYGAGYFGDFEMAQNLEAELGPPVWVPEIVCEVRPIATPDGDG